MKGLWCYLFHSKYEKTNNVYLCYQVDKNLVQTVKDIIFVVQCSKCKRRWIENWR